MTKVLVPSPDSYTASRVMEPTSRRSTGLVKPELSWTAVEKTTSNLIVAARVNAVGALESYAAFTWMVVMVGAAPSTTTAPKPFPEGAGRVSTASVVGVVDCRRIVPVAENALADR